MNKLEKQEVEEQFPDPKINKILDRKVIEYQDENNKVLDWRNNNKDRKTLIDWWEYDIQLTENYLKFTGRNAKPNLKPKKEGKKDMFSLAEYKPDNFDKDFVTYQCLTQNAMMFLEFASEKAFEMLDGCFDDDDKDVEELKFLFSETKISLLASIDTRI